MSSAEQVETELKDYLRDQNINGVFIAIVEQLLLSKPDNPIMFMIEYLAKNFPEQSRGVTINKAAAQSVPADDEDDSDDEDDEDDDGIMELPTNVPVNNAPRARRCSVSAESVVSQKKFIPTVIEKSEEQMKHINDIIKDNILFAHLDDEQMKIVMDAIAPGNAAPGESIITQGDLEAENFYILDQGCCEIFKDGKLVQTVTEAMSFGELALMYNAPRAATVTAKSPSKLWLLDRTTFKSILMDTTIKKRKLHTDFLLNVPILASLTDNERSTVADALKKEKYLDGEVIIKEGDPGDCFHIVEEGNCVCLKAASGDKPVMEISAGSYFGEIAILMDKPRQATVIAVGAVSTLTLERNTFKRVMGPLEEILQRDMSKYNSVMAQHI